MTVVEFFLFRDNWSCGAREVDGGEGDIWGAGTEEMVLGLVVRFCLVRGSGGGVVVLVVGVELSLWWCADCQIQE